jgi:glycyl-tRNA synthetase beta chain
MNLLIELFVEELPPKALNKLGEAFAYALYDYLESNWFIWKPDTIASDLSAEDPADYDVFSTPRRLAVLIRAVLPKAPDMNRSIKLMPVSVGLDANGKATPALIKRLQGMDLTEAAVPQLTKQMDGKNEVLFIEITQTGATLQEGLQKALDETLAKLPIPKVMTYQLADGWSSVNFVRPAHGLVAMHGSSVVAISALGLQSSNITHGHRFEAKAPTITINHADSYAQQLKTEGAVIASFAERKAEIARQLTAAAQNASTGLSTGLKPIDDDALLDEVTALVERPNVLLGQFEEIYLEVPQECLILTMKANQKYFPLLDKNDKLTNKFLIVSNISPKDPSFVIGGNERVVRPRLADAKFFFDQDRKKTLESRIAGLDKVVYHNKLGSQGERNKRVVAIASEIAKHLGDASLVAKVELAARLSKTDLVTDMVGEFPELQGIMGRYYAQHEGLDNDVAYAIEDHYKPRFAGDSLPRSQVGVCVALADKLETLYGLFSIGEKPTGDKDPFGLRRHALGIVRILIENKLPFPIYDSNTDCLVRTAMLVFADKGAAPLDILDFVFERITVNMRDKGFSSQEVDAVMSLKPYLLAEIPARLAAVRAFASLAEAPALAAANKRVGNILKKVEGEVKAEVMGNLLQEPAEISLFKALFVVKENADESFEAGDYTASLQELALLKLPIDDFFDNVMVHADDVALKNNRLGLLAILHQTMNRVADLSKLAS